MQEADEPLSIAGIFGDFSLTDIDVAVRRSICVGPHEGLLLEELGVFADRTYPLSRDDVLGDNDGLSAFAVEAFPHRTFAEAC